MYVYQTAQFQQGVTDFDLNEQLAELIEKIGTCNTYFEVGKLFDGAYPYLKHRIGKFRMIGQVRSVANRTIQVFVFFRVFERADNEYLEFLRYKGQSRGTELVQQGFQEQLLEEEARFKREKVKTSNILPAELRGWIEPLEELAVGRARTEYHIHELDSWKNSVFENFIEADESLRSLCQQLVDILETSPELFEIGQVKLSRTERLGSCSILWAYKSATEISLLHASVTTPSSEVVELAKKTMEDPEYHARVKRAYFSIVAYSYDLWRNIQKQEGGNLLLSTDEIKALTKMSGVEEEYSMPSVLVGRAGSGKSTMLAYAFAALLWKKARKDLSGTPVYISYNSRLLSNSRDLILLLLTANGEFGEQIENSSKETKTLLENIKKEADSYFFTFHDFLLSFINESNQQRFIEAKRVDFSDFKRAYFGNKSLLSPFQNLAVRKSISAERAWFVIRQFIKGSVGNNKYYGEDAIAELQANYQELSSKDQQGVAFEVISEIYKKVYDAWYQPNIEDDDLWDDQDLVNAAYESENDPTFQSKNFTAIVCDESQDFTPREIRFIVRASELLKYELDKETKLTLPYVLAGDSLQTLSPTGFRWSTVTSILYEEIFASSGVEVKTQTNQLSLNYRSVRPIVDFCNFIQLSRKDLFKNVEKEIQHQVAWDNSPRARPKYFQLNHNINSDELADLIKNRILLVPCEESGEVDYIKEDPILHKIFPEVSESNLPATVMSATAAKGLEYSHVFLYNFGREFKKEGFQFGKSENNFALEFFFNKLYVAASRAQSSLTVVETLNFEDEPTETNFWGHYLSPIDEPNVAPQYQIKLEDKFPEFKNHVEFLERGISGSWNDATARVSITEAQKFYSMGKENKDPRLINRASSLYKQIGGERNLLIAQECDALYLKFLGQSEAAGKAFESIGDFKEAWLIYFSSGDLWSQANKIREKISDLDPHEVSLVRFMSESKDDSGTLTSFLEQLSKYVAGGKRIVLTKPWLVAQNALSDRLTVELRENNSLLFLSEISKNLEIITSRDLVHLRQHLGEAHYQSKNWSEAIKFWANSNVSIKIFEDHRALAKANLRGFPEGLRELSSAGFKTEVIEVWRNHGSIRESLWLAEVIPALQSEKLFDEMLSLCLEESRIREALTSYRGLKEQDKNAAEAHIDKLVFQCSQNFEYFSDLRQLFYDASSSGKFNMKELCETVMVNAVRVWDDPQSYGYEQKQMQSYQQNLLKVGYGDGQRDAFLHVVKLYKPSKNERQLDPRWWGLCWELTGDWQSSAAHYLQYTESRDKPQIMESSRSGYIRAQSRLTKFHEESGRQSLVLEVQKTLSAKLTEWRFNSESKQNALRAAGKLGSKVPFFIEPTKSGDFTEDGDFGPFTWTTVGKSIRLLFDETDKSIGWRIDQVQNTIISNDGPLTKENDGCYRFEAEIWKIEVRFSREDIKVSLKNSKDKKLAVKVLKFRVV